MSVQQKADVCSNCHVTCDVAAMLSELQVGDKHFTEGIQRMEFDDHQRKILSFSPFVFFDCLYSKNKYFTDKFITKTYQSCVLSYDYLYSF